MHGHKRPVVGDHRAALRVHRALGPGLLESSYKACLQRAIEAAGLRVASEVEQPLYFDGARLDVGYRLDLVVEGMVVVETKAVERVLPVHRAQLLTYLRHGDYPLGLLLNFHEPLLRDGIHRVVNDAPDLRASSATSRLRAGS